MVTIGSELRIELNGMINSYGKPLRFSYFNYYTNADSFDDDFDFILSGTSWTSGIVFPINNNKGSTEAILLEQGKILNNDTTAFIQGDFNTSGTFRIGIGSPIEGEFGLIPDTIQSYEINGEKVFKQIFLRRLTNDKLKGEP